MTMKDCGQHDDGCWKKFCKCFKKYFWRIALVVVFIVLIVLLMVCVVGVKPHHPKFILQDVTINSFNVTGPTLNSLIQITVKSHNPNGKLGIYYDRLKTYATYHDQQITLPAVIRPVYQDTGDDNIWSPFLVGQNTPIAPFIGACINQDISMGAVELVIKFEGRIRYKLVNTVFKVPHHIHVTCNAVIPFGNSAAGVMLPNNAVKYQMFKTCNVDV